MGVECTIDGKRCFFTADNFFHQDMFSGSGGWMGLNRSFPLPYAASAKKVLDAAPDWVLAEHGGPFEFSAEDFRRRIKWGEASAAAADAIAPSGHHRHDWDPNGVTVEPLVHKTKVGAKLTATVVIQNPLTRARKLKVAMVGRGVAEDWNATMEVGAGATLRRDMVLQLAERVGVGRHVLPLRVLEEDREEPPDAFVVVDVE